MQGTSVAFHLVILLIIIFCNYILLGIEGFVLVVQSIPSKLFGQ